MRMVLEGMFCGTEHATQRAGVAGTSCVLGLYMIVEVCGLGDQTALCALPLASAQIDHQGADLLLYICGAEHWGEPRGGGQVTF